MLDRLSVSLAIATIIAVLVKITKLYERDENAQKFWFGHEIEQIVLYYILIGIFLMFLRGKMMHDDSGYFRDIDDGKFKTDWKSVAILKSGLLIGYVSWLLWAPAIYFLESPKLLSVFLGISLALSTGWLVFDIVSRAKIDGRRAWWIIVNLLYLAGLGALFYGVTPSIPATFLIAVLFIDWVSNDPFASHIPRERKPKEVAHRWFNEVWNDRKVPVIYELMAEGAVGHIEGPVAEIVGPGQFVTFQNQLLSSLPDIKVKILNSLSDDDDVCILWQAEARDGAVTFRGTTWFRVADGKITEGWDCWDHGALSAKLAARA